MIKEILKLNEELSKKVTPLVEGIANADPTTEEYGTMLSNITNTIDLISSLNMTLRSISENIKKEEGEKNESNN